MRCCRSRPASTASSRVAAVADWHVANAAPEKIKKAGNDGPALRFSPNPDILAAVAALSDRPYCVGFAAETGDLDRQAEDKRIRKKVDLIVGNRADEAFGRDDNALTLYDANGRTPLGHSDKLTLARQLVAAIAARLSTRGA